jgi:hypothetical protein
MFDSGENTDIKESTPENTNYVDAKHEKYVTAYKPNSLYWGIGIENEVYLEFDKKYELNKVHLINNRKRERYSVDYYTNYKKHCLEEALYFYINTQIDGQQMSIPILLNANSFTKTDASNNSITLYSHVIKPNPKFNGETLIETLKKHSVYYQETVGNKWLFDGDTIEFNTLNFFNAKLQDVINELDTSKCEFITNLNSSFKKLNIFNTYGPVKIMEQNHPFSTFMTNFKNVTMFNNGTLHYNITLPTQLNAKCKIQKMKKFIETHKKAIKIIQWMEPFIMAVYGSPDPFSNMTQYQNKNLFTNSSQRGAISRYIGIGTYNTDEMIKGKLLSKPISELACNRLEYWWFNEFYKNNAYTKLDEIGVDINFNKHYNHGIEIRFLEHIHDKAKLQESFEFIIYLMDLILENSKFDTLDNPMFNKLWNNVVLKSIINGKNGILTTEETQMYATIFDMAIYNTQINDIYYEIYHELIVRYNKIDKHPSIPFNNKYTLIPIGTFSKKTLNTQCKTIIDAKLQTKIKVRATVNGADSDNSQRIEGGINSTPRINKPPKRNFVYLCIIFIVQFFCNRTKKK